MSIKIQKSCLFILAITMFFMSVFGVFYAVKASLAYFIYHQAKYGIAKNNPRGIFRRCEEAYKLYPYNYYFCIWTAEKAYYTSFEVNEDEALRRKAIAEKWCNIGLNLNFYKSQLRLLKTRLLKESSINDSIKYWEEYVNWHFWEPYNHAVLVELYASSGDFGKAMESLAWVEGSKYYTESSKKINDAWKQEMSFELPSDIR